MTEYAKIDSPKLSRVHPTNPSLPTFYTDAEDDEKSFRSFRSFSSRASQSKSLKNGELGTSFLSSEHDDESPSDRNQSFETNSSSPVKKDDSNYYETTTFAQDDPFYMFRGDLIKKLLLVEGQLESYLEVVWTTVRVSVN
jgi:hypothetical protein